MPACTRRRALTVPADAAAPPESRRRCRLDVGTRLADRERSWSSPRSRPWRRSVVTTAPEESGEGQWPGFGLRWSVDSLRLLVAAQQWCGGYHPSQSVVPPPVVFTDTIRNPGPRPQPRNSLRLPALLADLVTIYHYIYRLVLLTSQPERVFIQPARIAAGGIFHQFISTH